MKNKILCGIIPFIVFVFAGCGSNYVATDVDSFIEVVNGYGYETVQVSSNDIEEYVGLLGYYYKPTEAYSAYNDADDILDIYIFSDNESAEFFYNAEKGLIASSKGDGTSSGTNLNDYQQYSQASNGYFQYIARIGDTVVDVMGDAGNETELKEIIEELGY